MANAILDSKNVGDIVKVMENGAMVNYLIIHKGKPSSMYDNSCDGIWLLREAPLAARIWDGANGVYNNDYENSDINAWLNGEFLNTIESKTRAAIKTVKIPFKKGAGDAETGVQSGSNGLSCKAFLISGAEVGFPTDLEDEERFYKDGYYLPYFSDRTHRIAKSGGRAVEWWLRSAETNYDGGVWYVNSNGVYDTFSRNTFATAPVRPAFILPAYVMVTSDGLVSLNNIPVITSDKTGDLGTLTSGFTCKYSINDDDAADPLTVTLMLDSTTIKTFKAEKGTQYTYSLTGNDWLKITNGSHKFTILATDGKDTVTSTATFTRARRKAMITLASALPADDIIRFCYLKVKGALPMDTVLNCEVTNNADDPAPVWEDCTVKVKSESVYIFKNNTAENGFAFNFRVTIDRGASGTGGYITQISGGFE